MSRRSLVRGGNSDEAGRLSPASSSANPPSNPARRWSLAGEAACILARHAMPSIPVQLRLGRPDDAHAIRALTLEAYRPWVALIGREPLPMTVDYDAARTNPAQLVAAINSTGYQAVLPNK